MKNPTINELYVVDTLGDDDCKECALRSVCHAICPLPINKHYEL